LCQYSCEPFGICTRRYFVIYKFVVLQESSCLHIFFLDPDCLHTIAQLGGYCYWLDDELF
jgi:hypothetical protein